MYFTILNKPSLPHHFNISDSIKDDEFLIAEEAAKVYYYSCGGWQEVWPLEFSISDDDHNYIGSYHVWILSSAPEFEATPI